jgi:hypothetical protein
MHLHDLPPEVRLQIFSHVVAAFQPRGVQIRFAPPNQEFFYSWSFAFYESQGSDYFADIPLLQVSKQTRQEVTKALASYQPLQLQTRPRQKDDWAQSFPSLHEALPPYLDYATNVRVIELDCSWLDPANAPVLPDLFTGLTRVLLYGLGSSWSPIHPRPRRKNNSLDLRLRADFCAIADKAGGFGPADELEKFEFPQEMERYSIDLFDQIQESAFLGPRDQRRFDLIMDFEQAFSNLTLVHCLRVRVVERPGGKGCVSTMKMNTTPLDLNLRWKLCGPAREYCSFDLPGFCRKGLHRFQRYREPRYYYPVAIGLSVRHDEW